MRVLFTMQGFEALASVLIRIYRVERTSLVAQAVKHLPEIRENWVQSLGWKYPLEEGVTTHSSILAPWTKESDRLQSMGLQRVRNN